MKNIRIKMWVGNKEVLICRLKGEIKSKSTVGINEDSLNFWIDATQGSEAILDLLYLALEEMQYRVDKWEEEGGE